MITLCSRLEQKGLSGLFSLLTDKTQFGISPTPSSSICPLPQVEGPVHTVPRILSQSFLAHSTLPTILHPSPSSMSSRTTLPTQQWVRVLADSRKHIQKLKQIGLSLFHTAPGSPHQSAFIFRYSLIGRSQNDRHLSTTRSKTFLKKLYHKTE